MMVHHQREAGRSLTITGPGALAGIQEQKEDLWPLEEGAGNDSGGQQGCPQVMQGDN